MAVCRMWRQHFWLIRGDMACFTCSSTDFAGTWWWLVMRMSAETRRGEEGCHISCHLLLETLCLLLGLISVAASSWASLAGKLDTRVTGYPGPHTTYDLEPSGERNTTNTSRQLHHGPLEVRTCPAAQRRCLMTILRIFLTLYFDINCQCSGYWPRGVFDIQRLQILISNVNWHKYQNVHQICISTLNKNKNISIGFL